MTLLLKGDNHLLIL